MTQTEIGFGFKVVVVGNSGVGKTSALKKFCGGKFPDVHNKSLVSQFYERSFNLKESAESIDLMIWDTPGRESLHLLCEDTYKDANICVVFYAVDDRESFEAIPTWVENVRQIAGGIQLVFVENKEDNLSNSVVPDSDAQRMAKQYDAPLFRISVKENLNLKPLFEFLAATLQSKYMSSLNSLPRGADAFFVQDFEEFDHDVSEISQSRPPKTPRTARTPRNQPQDQNNCHIA